MADSDQPKRFRTLMGFLDGAEPDGPNYKCLELFTALEIPFGVSVIVA